MLIIQKKSRFPLWIGIVFACVLIFVSFDREKIKEEFFTINDIVMAFDLGFSRLSQLGDGSLTEGAITFAYKLPVMLYQKLLGFPDRPDLERLDIDLKLSDHQLLLQDREVAMEAGFRLESNEVKANVRYQGKQYKARVRLKGNQIQHYRSPIAMSLNVTLRTKGTIQGFRKFSLHKPGARQFPYEQVFQDLVRESGNMAVPHKFIRVYVNGKSWGVMNFEESMTKEFLEKQESRESLVMKFASDDWKFYAFPKENPYAPYRLSDSRLYTSAYKSKKYLSDQVYRDKYSYMVEQRLQDNRDIFEPVTMSRLLLAAAVWRNAHTLAFGNLRFYVNPYSLILETISSDQGTLLDFKNFSERENEIFLNQVGTSLQGTLKIDSLERDLARSMVDISAVINQAPTIYQKYKSLFPFDREVSFDPLKTNTAIVQDSLDTIYEAAKAADETVRQLTFAPPTQSELREIPHFVKVNHYDDGKIRLFNLLPVPVTIESVYHNDQKLDVAEIVLPGFYDKDYVDIQTGVKGWQDQAISVQARIETQVRTAQSDFTLSAHPFNPLLAKTPLPAFFQKLPSGEFEVARGSWFVEKPVVLNGDLLLKPGASIRFAPDAYLIVKGALHAEGLEDSPILLQAADEEKGWKGLYVFEADGPSILQHVTINNTNATEDGMLRLTGGVSFYKSDVKIIDSVIEKTQAEDALNIIKSNFEIRNSKIGESRSDAFDSDFADGLIIESEFHNVGGDAVDFSGSKVEIVDNFIHQVKDKAVSGGEGSTLEVKGGLFRNVGVGVASKDGSTVTVSDVNVQDPSLNALMTYVKKDFFGTPVLIANDIKTNSQSIWSRQEGTILKLDGQLVDEQVLDVEALYQGEVMKK